MAVILDTELTAGRRCGKLGRGMAEPFGGGEFAAGDDRETDRRVVVPAGDMAADAAQTVTTTRKNVPIRSARSLGPKGGLCAQSGHPVVAGPACRARSAGGRRWMTWSAPDGDAPVSIGAGAGQP